MIACLCNATLLTLANVIARSEPTLQAFTGKTDPIDVMHVLRELKNNYK